MDRFALDVNCPPPPDLTPYISKEHDQYFTGGGFGDVYKCLYTDHDGLPRQVAVKALRFRFTSDRDKDNSSFKMLRRELGIWRRLDHANVVPFLGIAYGFGMHDAMSLVSLWMPNGSLHHFLEKYNPNLGMGHRLQFLLDIANGLHYLHSLLIVHGDLNCNNVLLDENYTVRLVDFGYASCVGKIPEAFSYLQRSTTRPGALRWIAPEQIETEETCTRTIKSDVYSFGCVALQVLSGKEPWSEVRQDAAVVLRLSKGQNPGRPESETLYDSHWNFIQECWSPTEDRPSAEVMVLSVQRFSSHCPVSQSLQDVLTLWSGPIDSLVDGSGLTPPSPPEASMNTSSQQAEPARVTRDSPSIPAGTTAQESNFPAVQVPGSQTVSPAEETLGSHTRFDFLHDERQSLQSIGKYTPYFDSQNAGETSSVLSTAHQLSASSCLDSSVEKANLWLRATTANINNHIYQCGWLSDTLLCGQYLSTFDDLVVHMGLAHDVQGLAQRIIVCRWWAGKGPCGREYKRNAFRRHIATHVSLKFHCNICGQSFSREDALRKHKMSKHDQV